MITSIKTDALIIAHSSLREAYVHTLLYSLNTAMTAIVAIKYMGKLFIAPI